jgi:hypothetical protein
VLRVLSSNEPLPLQNHTFREVPGIDIAFRGGDVWWPLDGNWFDPPFPRWVIRFICPWRVLPFVRWRLGRTVGYLGFKAWGVDDERYLNWVPAEHVRAGSVALTFSARLDADDH